VKISRTFLVVATVMIAAAPSAALAGIIVDPPVPGAVPEPTALLVWLGLTAAGALFFWRRGRGEQ
jgi:hypothetical protein